MAVGWLLTVIYASILFGFFALTFYILTFISSIKRKAPQLKDSELPFATVIIPAWNESDSVEKTLDSILKSNYPKFEVIFVDDGSTDNTYELAKKYEKDKRVRVFTKKNGGKASALNFGIKRANGEIIYTMDADTRVDKLSMKKMARYFKDESVVSVTPAMLVDNPNTILRRLQQIEYYLGIFLRKVFATLNAIYIAPGAFTVYRKWFFDKYGGYDEGNIVEDLEMALRIQSKGYRTENAPDANIYTLGPAKFKELTTQRIRWYTGLVTNFYDYRHMVSRKFGDLGLLVLPIGWITIIFSIFITISTVITSFLNTWKYLDYLNSINFNFSGFFNYTFFGIEKFLFNMFSNPLVIFVFFSIIATLGYMKYAESKTGKIHNLKRNLVIFFILFGPLFVYWWTYSFFKIIFSKKVTWR